MPNWCNNTIRILGSKPDLISLRKFVKGKKGEGADKESITFDFRKIIPYPKKYVDQDRDAARFKELKDKKECYDGYQCYNGYQSNKSGVDKSFFRDKPKKLTKKEEKELLVLSLADDPEKDGYNQGGYDWCIANWSTKWNSCEDGSTPKVIRVPEDKKATGFEMNYYFDTAWSPPTRVILKLSENYPKLVIITKWREEGGQAGEFICINGKLTSEIGWSFIYKKDKKTGEFSEVEVKGSRKVYV